MPEPSEPGLAQQVHRPSQDQRAHHHAHPAQVHHEVADGALGDAQPVGQEQRHDLDRAVERADADRVDPDEPGRRLVPAGEHVGDRRAARGRMPAGPPAVVGTRRDSRR